MQFTEFYAFFTATFFLIIIFNFIKYNDAAKTALEIAYIFLNCSNLSFIKKIINK